MSTLEKTMNSILTRATLSLACLLFWHHASVSQIPAPNDSQSQISVRISVEHSHFRPGEDVPLRVEIWNKGNQDVFIFKNIDVAFSNALAVIDLTLYDGKQADRPMVASVSDSFASERSSYPPLAGELPKYWIAVPPQHFYGGEVMMRASSFERLRVPGKYRVQGKYSSRGFLAQDINNPLLHYAQELKKLPYQAWVGAVDTNSIYIEVGYAKD
jgi:hypothetical protein